MKRISLFCLILMTTMAAYSAQIFTDDFHRTIEIRNLETNPKKAANEVVYINQKNCIIHSPANDKLVQSIRYDKQHNTFFVRVLQGKKIVGRTLYDMFGTPIRRFDYSVFIEYLDHSVVAKQTKDTTKVDTVLKMSINEYNGRACMRKVKELQSSKPEEAAMYYEYALQLQCPIASESELADLYLKAAKEKTYKADYFLYDKAAHLGNVPAMEAMIRKYTTCVNTADSEEKKQEWRNLLTAWAGAASDRGSMYGTYVYGEYLLAKGELPKAEICFEQAANAGITGADEALRETKEKMKPVSVKGKLPAELSKHLQDLTNENLYVLARKGYIDAIEEYCTSELFFSYLPDGEPDIFSDDSSEESGFSPLSERTAAEVIPLLQSAAPRSNKCKFLLACCLSDKRCFGVAFPAAKEHPYVNIKQAQKWVREFMANPPKNAEDNPFRMSNEQIRQMAEKILSYDANYQRPAVSVMSGVDINQIARYSDTSVGMTDKEQKTTTYDPNRPPTNTTYRTMEQLVYYPMGLACMPKDGEGLMSKNKLSELKSILSKNGYEYKASTYDNSVGLYLKKDGMIRHGSYSLTPYIDQWENDKNYLSSWWYISYLRHSNLSKANKEYKAWLKELQDMGFTMNKVSTIGDKYDKKQYWGRKGSYRVELKLGKYADYEIQLHVYPKYYK